MSSLPTKNKTIDCIDNVCFVCLEQSMVLNAAVCCGIMTYHPKCLILYCNSVNAFDNEGILCPICKKDISDKLNVQLHTKVTWKGFFRRCIFWIFLLSASLSALIFGFINPCVYSKWLFTFVHLLNPYLAYTFGASTIYTNIDISAQVFLINHHTITRITQMLFTSCIHTTYLIALIGELISLHNPHMISPLTVSLIFCAYSLGPILFYIILTYIYTVIKYLYFRYNYIINMNDSLCETYTCNVKNEFIKK